MSDDHGIDHYGTDEESLTNQLLGNLEELDDSKDWTPPRQGAPGQQSLERTQPGRPGPLGSAIEG